MIITEEEKNRIRKLHREYSTIKESPKDLYEGMDANANIDTDNMSDKEEDWTGGDWDSLDDNIKETYKQHEEFQDMDDDAIREKFNAMDKPSLCKIARFMFGWVARIFKPLSWFDKQQRSGMGGSGYKPAWRCR